MCHIPPARVIVTPLGCFGDTDFLSSKKKTRSKAYRTEGAQGKKRIKKPKKQQKREKAISLFLKKPVASLLVTNHIPASRHHGVLQLKESGSASREEATE